METKVPELYQWLVGSSIDFSFKRKSDDVQSIENNIRSAKVRISKSLSLIHNQGVSPMIKIYGMAALLEYYTEQPYYMAVRSSIELRRLRVRVIEYLRDYSVDERVQHLRLELSKKKNSERDILIEGLRYFLMTYPSRLKDFRSLLTREEFMIVA